MGQCECQTKEAATSLLAIPLENIQSDYPIETGLFSYPQRFFILKSTPPTSFSTDRPIHIQFSADFSDEIQLSINAHSYLSQALRALTVDLQIKNVYLDELNITKILYSVSKKGEPASLFIRNFYGFDEDYLNIAYEINTYLIISYLKCRQLHSIRQHFVVVPEQSAIDFYSHVALLQPIDSTLSLIIRQRRRQKKIWTHQEFMQLFNDLVEALSILHENGLNHNDIRPSNVYYSLQKKCFMLGSFSNITRQTVDKRTKQIKESNHYKDLFSTRKITRLSSIQLANLDLAKSDVYSLGMTLLSAFYLCQSIDRKKCAPYNRSLLNDFPYLAIIKHMTCKIDQRKSIFQIKNLLQSMMAQKTQVKQNPIYSIEVTYPPTSGIFNKRESYIAEGYRCLGMISKWKDKLKEIFMREESIQNSAENAKKFEQLAISSQIEGKREKSMSEYAQAAQIYTNLGTKHFQEGSYRLAIDAFRRGLQNFEKIDQKQSQQSYLRLLVKMTECQITSGHKLIDENQLQNLEKDIQKIKSSNPIHYWEYMRSIYNIYDYYEDYKKLSQVLTRNEKSIEGIKTKINILTLKRRIIRNNIKLATSSPNFSFSLLDKTVGIIHEVFENYEYYLLQHPLQKLKMDFLMAKCQFLLKPHCPNLEKIVVLSSKLDSRLLISSRERQAQNELLYTQVYIQIFTEIGDCYFNYFKDNQEALTNYSKAFYLAKEFFGDIYNKHCAVLLQRIGKVNKSIDKFKTYLQFNQLAGKIYRNIYCSNHKAILRISKRVKDQLEETINQTMCNSNHLQEASVN